MFEKTNYTYMLHFIFACFKMMLRLNKKYDTCIYVSASLRELILVEVTKVLKVPVTLFNQVSDRF